VKTLWKKVLQTMVNRSKAISEQKENYSPMRSNKESPTYQSKRKKKVTFADQSLGRKSASKLETKVYPNGERYVGEVNLEGKRHGRGIYYYLNGDRYEGAIFFSICPQYCWFKANSRTTKRVERGYFSLQMVQDMKENGKETKNMA
jgi:hypothetical protein